MIVKNEEEVLARCLSSAKEIVDEIIIVDTGSTDKTKEIAAQFTDKIYDFKWVEDFSKARNFSFSKATSDYQMWLDADDIIDEENKTKLLELKKNLTADIYMLKYNVGHGVSYYRERILKREKNYQWLAPIHECISPVGNVIRVDIAVTHSKKGKTDPDRNLRIFEKMVAENYPFSMREKYYYARELMWHNRVDEAIVIFEEVIKSPLAYLPNRINGIEDIADCYKSQGKAIKATEWLLYSFVITQPRAEICCALGDVFLEQKNYVGAIYWYKSAFNCKLAKDTSAFSKPDCYDFYPSLQLVLCYWAINEYELSKKYHELCKSFKPDSPVVAGNEKWFISD
jgi:glycosyltransferase involved in cell wall biosynthesis